MNILYKHKTDRFELDLYDETIRIQNFISVESYDEKTTKNYRNCYVAVEHIFSRLLKISIQNYGSTNVGLE